MNQGRCKSCGAAILWAPTFSEKMMPIDSAPLDPDHVLIAGQIWLDQGHAVVTRANDAKIPGVKYYTPHWASCSSAAQHRKAKP